MRTLIAGYANWRRSRWGWAVAYLVWWVALWGVPVLIRRDPSWVYLGIWAAVLLLGSVAITIAAWRLTAAVNANRD